jgi:hypothetical protein
MGQGHLNADISIQAGRQLTVRNAWIGGVNVISAHVGAFWNRGALLAH